MKVTSTAIQNGKIADIYGKRGPADPYGIPSLSPPLEFTGAPEGTVSYAVIVEDKDAFPGFGRIFLDPLAGGQHHPSRIAGRRKPQRPILCRASIAGSARKGDPSRRRPAAIMAGCARPTGSMSMNSMYMPWIPCSI